MATGTYERVLSALALVIALNVTGCSPDAPTGAPAAPSDDTTALNVYTVSYPLQYFAERIGGEQVKVVLPAPPDVDPAYWSPEPETIAAYQAADLILLNGAGYAKWTERASLPRSRSIDTSASFSSRYVPLEDAVTHGHGPAGEHSHEGYAFTTWLDPTLAIEQARAILEAFVVARPEHEPVFREGFAALETDLLDLDRQLGEWSRKLGDAPLLFSHPVYQYLERRYGLGSISLHWEPDEAPDEGEWRRLEELIHARPGAWMVWERRPLDATLERLRSVGVESVVLEPCASRPAEGDFLDVMRRGIADLERIAID